MHSVKVERYGEISTAEFITHVQLMKRGSKH
jgi:hypothetical protein